ncbi:hypothetical protein CEP50_09080 [Actinopolyspora mortivallis]|uniref:Uncharacterized protein n=1 Tax=Actinopolyspora mortivallis TaxID=33906 RepID=A0A2T0GXB5_ACTMO|nr:hypothetical protein CEP50_09080 [Actinopolyspora mortivallis]
MGLAVAVLREASLTAWSAKAPAAWSGTAGRPYRLFPDAPGTTEPWRTLLWATGRADLPGHPRRDTWRWDDTPRA